MSVRNTVHFTTRSTELPAAASTAFTFSNACLVWPAIPVSASWRVPGVLPSCPERIDHVPDPHGAREGQTGGRTWRVDDPVLLGGQRRRQPSEEDKERRQRTHGGLRIRR